MDEDTLVNQLFEIIERLIKEHGYTKNEILMEVRAACQTK